MYDKGDTMKNNKTRRIILRVTERDNKYLDFLTNKLNTTKSEVVRKMINQSINSIKTFKLN